MMGILDSTADAQEVARTAALLTPEEERAAQALARAYCKAPEIQQVDGVFLAETELGEALKAERGRLRIENFHLRICDLYVEYKREATS